MLGAATITRDNRVVHVCNKVESMVDPTPIYDAEQRLLISAVTLCVLVLLGAPMVDLMFMRDTWSFRLSITTEYPRLIALAFVVATGTTVPMLYWPRHRWAMRLACFGGCVGAFASYGMAFMGRNIVDIGLMVLPWLSGFSCYFVLTGTISLGFAATLAVILNTQMLRALTNAAIVEEPSHVPPPN